MPTESYGIDHFWSQGDAITHTVALILLAMSILSWTQIALKTWRAARHKRTIQAVENFWKAETLENAVSGLTQSNPASTFSDLARQATAAASHYDAHNNESFGSSGDRGEFLTRALRQSIMRSTARLESGLTLLASIGSIAPFVGLFGTVWGIYHALLAIASTSSASIDKVSGPVGEALIMTAAGLFVAIPAVLAYNTFTRLNRIELAELDGFAHDLHACMATGSRIGKRPNIRVVEKGVS
ncbi:MAG: MotA/TolQ/ExbB proton channel family protein [Methylocystaceae bacterium]|nr:MotA/TolQ/ExbB proton channel family protein [Methylocystaceae bacterium]